MKLITMTAIAVLAAVYTNGIARANCQADIDPRTPGAFRHVMVYDHNGPGTRNGDVVFTGDKRHVLVNGFAAAPAPQFTADLAEFLEKRALHKQAKRLARDCSFKGKID